MATSSRVSGPLRFANELGHKQQSLRPSLMSTPLATSRRVSGQRGLDTPPQGPGALACGRSRGSPPQGVLGSLSHPLSLPQKGAVTHGQTLYLSRTASMYLPWANSMYLSRCRKFNKNLPEPSRPHALSRSLPQDPVNTVFASNYSNQAAEDPQRGPSRVERGCKNLRAGQNSPDQATQGPKHASRAPNWTSGPL